MLRNYLKVIFRILTRNKLYSFINVSGLAVGFACCTLVLVYVRHELSYDRYHEDANSIYRVALNWENGKSRVESAHLRRAAGPVIEARKSAGAGSSQVSTLSWRDIRS